MHCRSLACALLSLFAVARASAVEPAESPGDRMLAAYFKAETAKLRDGCLAEVKTLADWNGRRDEYRRQLREMLGIDPLPPRTDLHATVTGRVERDDFVVEKVHFQSKPGLYVTANLYLPKSIDKPCPAILYLCGHGAVKKDGVSYGNKVFYQHHGIWFARHGYACLVVDSLQLGEIEGIHHGTYRYDRWWWNARGYTPAGVEAWNCIRALDYLQTRKEIDPERIGATGRSGGGAYTWFVAALDDRVKAAVPAAGITDLENHVIDGTVEGHCDCMYFVNTYRWDYPQLAALVAPRPLLISNTDKDRIFPLEGVQRTHAIVRRIYKLHEAEKNLGLHITEGPHEDTQELYMHSFVWFDRFLGGGRRAIDGPAEPLFKPEELKVFDKLPEDQINTKIDETFVPTAPEVKPPKNADEWATMRDGWMKDLKEKTFRGWPENPPPLDVKVVASAEVNETRATAIDFTSQEGVRLRYYAIRTRDDAEPLTLYSAPDQKEWRGNLAVLRKDFEAVLVDEALPESSSVSVSGNGVFFSSRGVGATPWSDDPKKGIQNRRRFMLLGQTLAGMRVWDVRRAIQSIRSLPEYRDSQIILSGGQDVLYASLFEADIAALELRFTSALDRDGLDFLNVRRSHDIPNAVAMALERSTVKLQADSPDWVFVTETSRNLGWEKKGNALDKSQPRFQHVDAKTKPKP